MRVKRINKKGGDAFNKNLENKISALYISMSDKASNKNTYRLSVNQHLDKLNNKSIEIFRIDLTNINIKTLATCLGQLSEDVKLFMKLLTAPKYYALNDRTINLLMKGDIDMSATTSGKSEEIKESDATVISLLDIEKEIEIFVVDKNKTRAGGAFFPYLNNTIFDLDKYGILKQLREIIINIIVYTLH